MHRVENSVIDGSGGYFKKILFFAIPLMLTGILQTFYNAADLIIVGHFEGELAIAAVGNTGSLVNLIIGICTGLSVGAGVCVAHSVGAGDAQETHRTVHTAIPMALIFGVVFGAVGFIFAPEILKLMGTPESVINMSVLYVRIVFLGAPGVVLYNFLAAMLRSYGDSKRPLIFLAISGVVNVLLNVVAVAAFGLGVAGVAIATIVSQYLSAILASLYLMKTDSVLKIFPSKIRLYGDRVKKILLIGVPSGVQGMLFSFSNVIVQSSVNSLGDVVMAGNAAAANLDAFHYVVYNAFYHSTLTYVGQSAGAKKYGEVKKIILASVANIMLTAAVLVPVGMLTAKPLLALYLPDSPEALSAAMTRCVMLLSVYFLCGVMEVATATLRSLGYSTLSMSISLIFACAYRIVWLLTVFVKYPFAEMIYVTYPISWILTLIVCFTCIPIVLKRLRKKSSAELSE